MLGITSESAKHKISSLPEVAKSIFNTGKRALKKIRKNSVYLSGLFRSRTNRPVVVLVVFSGAMNIRTLQNMIYYFEKDYFIWLVLPNPVLWVPFLMYLYPYPHLTLCPGSFLWKSRLRKVLVSDWYSFGLGHRVVLANRYDEGKLFLPYFINPDYCWRYPFKVQPVNITRIGLVFFAGNVDDRVYGNALYEDFYQMPNRLSVYRMLRAQKNVVYGELFDGQLEAHQGRLFIHTLQNNSLDPSNYTRYLSEFNFVICAPGVSMPLCHNLIEAMEAGCIPIFSYPEWLPAGLAHGKNCLIYKTLEELDSILNDLTNISSESIATMRNQLWVYFHETYQNMAMNWFSEPEIHIVNERKSMIPLRQPIS